MIDPSPYVRMGITSFKIEGRTRPPNAVRGMIRCIRQLLSAEQVALSPDTGDPYSVADRLPPRQMGWLRPQASGPVSSCLPEAVMALWHMGAIGQDTQFWLLPLYACSLPPSAVAEVWSGIVINDLLGPPFANIHEGHAQLQWQSPLYCYPADFDAIQCRLGALIEVGNVVAARVHDVGLLEFARRRCPKGLSIVWDRFGWPARNPIPLDMMESFLATRGARCFEYGADQPTAVAGRTRAEHGLMVMGGRLAAVIPPKVKPLVCPSSYVSICGDDGRYLALSGVLVKLEDPVGACLPGWIDHPVSQMVVAAQTQAEADQIGITLSRLTEAS